MSEHPLEVLYIDIEYNIEDEEYGPMYIATNDRIGLVTDGKTFEELRENLKEALSACTEVKLCQNQPIRILCVL